MGKGDSRRPPAVSDAELARRWEETFGRKKKTMVGAEDVYSDPLWWDEDAWTDEMLEKARKVYGPNQVILVANPSRGTSLGHILDLPPYTVGPDLTARPVAPTVSSAAEAGADEGAKNAESPSRGRALREYAARESNPEPTD